MGGHELHTRYTCASVVVLALSRRELHRRTRCSPTAPSIPETGPRPSISAWEAQRIRPSRAPRGEPGCVPVHDPFAARVQPDWRDSRATGRFLRPSTGGAIDSLDYREDRIEFSPPFPGPRSARIRRWSRMASSTSAPRSPSATCSGRPSTYWPACIRLLLGALTHRTSAAPATRFSSDMRGAIRTPGLHLIARSMASITGRSLCITPSRPTSRELDCRRRRPSSVKAKFSRD